MKLAFTNFLAAAIALALATLGERAVASPSEAQRRGAFDVASHLGNLSPYLKAPVPFGIETALPNDCQVEQVMLVCTSPNLRAFSCGARMRECMS